MIMLRIEYSDTKEVNINQNGIPLKVSIDGKGKLLAVEVSRNGQLKIDLIRLDR